jgi:hypothetical protein
MEQQDLDPEAMIEHIGDCIHEFSLLALPWAESENAFPGCHPSIKEVVFRWLDRIKPPLVDGRLPQHRSFPMEVADQPPKQSFIAAEYFAEDADDSGSAERGRPPSDDDLQPAEVSGTPPRANSDTKSSQLDVDSIEPPGAPWVDSETSDQKSEETPKIYLDFKVPAVGGSHEEAAARVIQRSYRKYRLFRMVTAAVAQKKFLALRLKEEKMIAAAKAEQEAKEAAKKKAEEEAARKKAEEEAAKKKAEEEAARKKAEEEAARKKAEEEAARKKAEEEAAKKKAEEEAAWQKQLVAEAKLKAERKAAEAAEQAAKKKAEEEAVWQKLEEAEAKLKAEVDAKLEAEDEATAKLKAENAQLIADMMNKLKETFDEHEKNLVTKLQQGRRLVVLSSNAKCMIAYKENDVCANQNHRSRN